MKLERDADGNFFIDPAMLAQKLCLTANELQRMMRLGLVTSTVEAGVGSDEGQQRLTVRRGNFIWRAVIDAEHHIVSEEALDLRKLAEAQGGL